MFILQTMDTLGQSVPIKFAFLIYATIALFLLK